MAGYLVYPVVPHPPIWQLSVVDPVQQKKSTSRPPHKTSKTIHVEEVKPLVSAEFPAAMQRAQIVESAPLQQAKQKTKPSEVEVQQSKLKVDRSRTKSVAPDVVSDRSRSKSHVEHGVDLQKVQLRKESPRGRSAKTKTEQILSQLVAAQDNKMIRAAMKHHLGKFALAFTDKLKDPERATSEPPKKLTRTYDDIADIAARDIPFGAGLQKQRVNSLGAERVKFRGQLVK